MKNTTNVFLHLKLKLHLFSILCVCLYIWLYVWPPALNAADPSFKWETLESEHFKIHFHDDEKNIAIQTASISENVYKNLKNQFAWEPESRIEMVLIDETDLANGSATTIPFNQVILHTVPGFKNSSLERTDYHLERLITHELTHIFHLDKCSGWVPLLRSILGRHFWFFPGIYQPEWMIEGLATYFETNHEKEFGRGQGSYYEMKMRIETLKGLKSIRKINLSSSETPYLYGYYFYQFLEEKYGKEKILALIDEYSNNILPFFINTNSKKIYKKNLIDLWAEFETHMKNKFEPQLEELKKSGLKEGSRLTNSGDVTCSPIRALPNGDVYYILNEPQKEISLIRKQNNRKETKITTLHADARMDIHPKSGIILSMPEYSSAHRIYQDLYLLKHDDKKPERLTHGARYIGAAWLSDGMAIAAVQVNLGKSQLHLLDLRQSGKKNMGRGPIRKYCPDRRISS